MGGWVRGRGRVYCVCGEGERVHYNIYEASLNTGYVDFIICPGTSIIS